MCKFWIVIITLQRKWTRTFPLKGKTLLCVQVMARTTDFSQNYADISINYYMKKIGHLPTLQIITWYNRVSKLRIQLKLNTALLSTVRASVRPFVTGVTSHISHIYKGITAMLIIRGPIKPYIFWIQIILAIFQAKTRPNKTFFSALTNLTIAFDWSKELSKI